MTEKAFAVPVCDRPLQAVVTIPGSKSITNRALPMAALADGVSRLTGVLFSDDSRYFLTALTRLGYGVHTDEQAATAIITGRGLTPLVHPDGIDLFVGNSGTTARFLSAFASLGSGIYRIDGVERMRQRPIRDLLHALDELGVTVVDEAGTGCPPIRIHANGLRGGKTAVRGTDSSQFLSALLIAAPYAQQPVDIVVEGELVSAPYVDMTVQMMRQFGAQVMVDGGHYRVFPGAYQARAYAIEPDASGASYFLAAAAACGGQVTVVGLSAESLQGDAAFAGILEQMGCHVEYATGAITVQGPTAGLQGIDVDLFAMSDLLPTLSAIAPLAKDPVTIRNVANTRLKETDRIAACVTELRKFGVSVEEFPDGLRVFPCDQIKQGVSVATYDDHRMAMAFAVLGLRVPGTSIENPNCVAKTFPDFFARFERMWTCASDT